MNRTWPSSIALLGGLTLLASQAYAGWPGDSAKCKPDAVKAGSVCMDKYEASVWQIPASNHALITKVQNGTATLAALTAGGATQISAPSGLFCSPAFPLTFPGNGQWTQPLYAVSIPGVHPTACVSWFQAQQACGNSRKRLPSNAEWQLAVAGSPDPGGDNGTTDCNTANISGVVNTGSRTGCKSSWGAFDMVGNVSEWVADWMPLSTGCPGWGFGFSDDVMCLSGASPTEGPGAVFRGGGFGSLSNAGPLSVDSSNTPPQLNLDVGFRCAR